MIKRQRQPEPAESWWFNIKTKQVEFGLLTAASYRIGPFATQSEAANALDLLRNRSISWTADDEKLD